MKSIILDGLLNYSSTLKIEAIRSSETSGATQRTTRRHIPEDDTLQIELSSHVFICMINSVGGGDSSSFSSLFC
jgi:hypothetical protein